MRLRWILQHPPLGIPRLLQFGLTITHLRLELERVEGHPLYSCLPLLSQTQKGILRKELRRHLSSWRHSGFVHGDLSLRNILVDFKRESIWLVDWLLELKSFQATPRYASPKIYRGIHDFTTDAHAMEIVIKELT